MIKRAEDEQREEVIEHQASLALWFSTLYAMPVLVNNPYQDHQMPQSYLFPTEKAAINNARQLRVAEIDRLQAEVNQLDERFDAIEDAEMAAEANHPR